MTKTLDGFPVYGEISGLRARIAELEAERDELRDRWMRSEAEMANVRARAKRDAENGGKAEHRIDVHRRGQQPAQPAQAHETPHNPTG